LDETHVSEKSTPVDCSLFRNILKVLKIQYSVVFFAVSLNRPGCFVHEKPVLDFETFHGNTPVSLRRIRLKNALPVNSFHVRILSVYAFVFADISVIADKTTV